jgi:hypothetical protein
MLRVLAFATVSIVMLTSPASAQSARTRGPEQVADSIEIANLARTLTRDVATDSARAARLYEWVARNLSYDVQGFLRGRLADGTPENVYRKRLAVCGGYVALFERLGREVGLETQPILGYAKGFTYRSGASTKDANHSWIGVRIGNGWRLVDPTWGSGYVNGTTFERHFSWDYFLVDPNALILSHFPEESAWQFLSQPMRRKEFEKLPLIPRTLVNVGFDPTVIRTSLLAKRIQSFPSVGVLQDVRIISAPLNGTLPRQSTVSIEVVWPGATEVALVSGGVWRKLKRDGDRFHGEAVAAESAVALVGRDGNRKEYDTLLHYQVN